MTWGRHTPTGDSRWHFIDCIQIGGSVQTRCAGRWPAADEYREDDSPPLHERCQACMRELVNAPVPTSSMRGIAQMDLTDLDEPVGGDQ